MRKNKFAVSMMIASFLFTVFLAQSAKLVKAQDTTTIPVGQGPMGIAFDPANGLMYVANWFSGSVSVINDTLVVDTIGVRTNPLGIAYNPVNHDIYVANNGNDTISVIDSTNNTVVATITVVPPPGTGPAVPWGIAYSPDYNYMYVTTNTGVCVINASSNAVLGYVEAREHAAGPFAGIAYNSVVHKIYLTSPSNYYGVYRVVVISGLTVETYIDVGNEPMGVAYNPVNHDIYVTNSGNDTVSVIDSITNNVVSTIPVGNKPYGVAFDPAINAMFVVNSLSNNVSIINDMIVANMTISVGFTPQFVAYNPTNYGMYVTNYGDNTVTLVPFEIVPEFPPSLLVPTLITLTLVVVVLTKTVSKKRKMAFKQ